MSLNKHRTPSGILNSNLIVPNHTKRDSFTPMPSKQSDIVELSNRNPIGNRPQDLPRYKNSFPAENQVNPMTWSSPFEDSPPPETKHKAPLVKGKSTTGFQKASKDENVPAITSSNTNRHLGPWLSEEGYTRKPTSHEGRKSYTRLWKEGRDMRDALKNMSGNRSVNMDQEVVKVNSYLKQHQNKMVKKNAAASVIQRWFRERLQKRQEKNFYGKQGARIKMPRTQSQEIKRAKEVGNSKRSQKQLQQQQNYEYEEQETDRNLNNGAENSSENRVLEEMYRKMQANILSRIDKRSNQDSSTNRDAQRTLESYSSREQARNVNNAKQAQARGQYMQTSPDRVDTWERSPRQEAYTFRDFERAAIVIQRGVRVYLRGKRRVKQSKGKNVGQGDNMYKIIEQLANELKQANLKVAGLQRENEKLRNDMSQTEEKIEKAVEARVVSEKAKFKDMLEEYTQFIDKLLQEKMGITQHYEMIVSANKELKAQISKYEAEDNRKELEEKIEELQNENKALQEKCNKLSSEVRALEEEKKDLCSMDSVKKLEDENKKLRARAKDLETQFNQAIDRIAKYSQVGEINQILLQKLQFAGDHIQEIEEKLRVSEEQYKALEQKYKGSINSNGQAKENTNQEVANNVQNQQRMYIGDNSPKKAISPSKPQQTVKDEEEVIIGEPSLAQSITIPTKRSLAGSDHQKAGGEEPVDFSFEAKGSGVYDQETSSKGGSKTNLEHEDIQSIVKEVRSARRQEENGEYQEEENEGEERAHPFELRKGSGDYVSGKFPQQEESSVVQETTLDEEQGNEINMLIQNISRKLELAKTKMEDRPITTIEETEEENILSYRDPAFHKALSSKELAGEQEAGLKLENRAKSTVNLHKESFTMEEQEQGKEGGSVQKKKSEAKGGNVKKGILDTLKKAELLFGRGDTL